MPDSLPPGEAPQTSPAHASPWVAPSAVLHWLPTLAVSTIILVLGQATVIGADTMWMVAMGHDIARHGAVPQGVPFAAADSDAWVNVTALGQLAFAGAHQLGSLGLPMLTLAIVAGTLIVVSISAQRLGAAPTATAAALVLLSVGCLPALGVVRGQVLSLLPFAVLVLLLRSDYATIGKRIWWSVPLIAVWGNLHGAALAGVGVLLTYVLFSRVRRDPARSVAVGLAAIVAIFVTPGLMQTWRYYLGVLSNEAAQRGSELWGRLDLSEPFDLLAAAAGLLLVGAIAFRRRAPLWEWIVLASWTVATLMAARHSVWLLLFATPRAAACATPRHCRGNTPRLPSAATMAAGGLVAAIAAGVLFARHPSFSRDDATVSAIARVAGSDIVLAPEPLVESLAAAGVKVWMGNPIDAFTRVDQSSYLDVWLGKPTGSRALDASTLVVAQRTSPALALARDRGFRVTWQFNNYAVLSR